jgi:hypothetical protein
MGTKIDIHGDVGKPLNVGTTSDATYESNKENLTQTADMSANWVSMWMRLPPTPYNMCIQPLWTGSPTGVWTVHGRNLGPGTDLELVGVEAVDGTTYAGDLPPTTEAGLTAAVLKALETEDLGTTVINISGFGGGEVQLRYAATSGTGSGQAWARVVA